MKFVSHFKRILLLVSIQDVVTQDRQTDTATRQETDKEIADRYLKKFYGVDPNSPPTPQETAGLEPMRSHFSPPTSNRNDASTDDATASIRHDDSTYNYLKSITPSEARGGVCYEPYVDPLVVSMQLQNLSGFWYDKHGYRFVTLEISDRLIKLTIDQSPTQEFRGDFRRWTGDFFSLLGGNPLLYEQSVIPRLLSMKKQQNSYELIMTRRPVTNSVYLHDMDNVMFPYRDLMTVRQGNIFCSVDKRYMTVSIEVKHWEMKNKTDDRLYIFLGLVRFRTHSMFMHSWISGECMGPLVIDRKTGVVYPVDPYSGCGRNPENDIYLQQYTKKVQHGEGNMVSSITSVLTGMTVLTELSIQSCS